MISPEQSRAARAILNWKQVDVAKVAHTSVTAINYFERGIGSARGDTVLKLQAAYEEHGIEFLSSGGLRRKETSFQFLNYQGQDFIQKLNDDIFSAVRKGNDKIFTCSADENAWEEYGKDSSLSYYDFIRKKNITEYILIKNDANVIKRKNIVYRKASAELIGKITYTLYADRVCYLLWAQSRVVIIKNIDLSNSMKLQFQFLWDAAHD